MIIRYEDWDEDEYFDEDEEHEVCKNCGADAVYGDLCPLCLESGGLRFSPEAEVRNWTAEKTESI